MNKQTAVSVHVCFEKVSWENSVWGVWGALV